MVRQKDLEGKLNNSTDFLGVLSVGGVFLSGILLFTPIKAVGYIGVGSSLGAFAASVVARKKHLKAAKQHLDTLTNQHKSDLSEKDTEILGLVGEVNTLTSKLKKLAGDSKAQALELSNERNRLETLTVQNQSQKQLIERVTGELDRLIALARTAVDESLEEWDAKLSSLVDTKKEQYPKLTERLNALLEEGRCKIADYAIKLASTPSKWDSLADLLSLYYCINDDMQNVKIKAVQAIAKLTVQEKQLELEEADSILEEWENAKLVPREKVEGMIAKYEAMLQEFRLDLNQRFDGVVNIAKGYEQGLSADEEFFLRLRMQIQKLEAQVQELSKPITYPAATRTDMRIANIVISYFERLGFILDRAGSDYRGYEATLEFITDRTGRLVLASELNDHSERLQGLTHVLNSPEFKLDPETGLMTLLVRWAKKPATDTSNQAKRLLTPLDEVIKKLVSSLSHKPTVRVMGATGEGKGVMVRYLLNSILANNPWYCRLHDPQDGSSEDHWGIPKVSRSGKELQQALKGIEKQLTDREASKNWDVVTLDVLDEIDTHLDRQEKKEAFIDLISRIRHCGMKLILIGQNPKVGRAGFEWSDMQQMNCIYMGASALDAIEANPQLRPRKDKLTKDYLALSEYYESANEGLDDSEKYLFGLVVIPGKIPLWIELPRPDSIKIDCDELLLGNIFNIPDSLKGFVKSKNSVKDTGKSAKTNSNSHTPSSAETEVNQTLAEFPDKPDYVEVANPVGKTANPGLTTCKYHPDAELRLYGDGRHYCPSCKKKLTKSEVEYRS
ncbi:MAG TPA: hypothetical protein V6C85_39110 [Allocoleopsis sp.]